MLVVPGQVWLTGTNCLGINRMEAKMIKLHALNDNRLVISAASESWQKIERLIYMGRQRLLAGDEMGAASLWNEAYKNYPDGNEAMIVLPQSNPQYFQQLIQQGQIDPNLAQSKVLVISKQHGMIPFNDMKDLDMMIAEEFNQTNYLEKVRETEAKLTEANNKAQMNPVQMENGKWMRESYTADSNGVIQFIVLIPYEGCPIPMPEQNKVLRASPGGIAVNIKPITTIMH